MTYVNEDFRLRQAKSGDGALVGYLNGSGEPKFVTSAAGLPVTLVSGGSGGAVEGVAATGSAIAGVDPVLIGGVTHTSLPSPIASNLLRNILVDEYGRLVVNLRDDSGNNLLTSGLVVQLGATGTAPTSLGKAEDAAHSSGDAGVMTLGVRNDAAASQTSANGNYGAISLDAAGRQFAYAGPVEEIVGTASTITTLTNLSAVDCYAAGYTHCLWTFEVATGTATLIIERSNDNVNWATASVIDVVSGLQGTANAFTTPTFTAANDFQSFMTPVEARYLRWRLSATSGGVTTVRAGFHRGPIPPTFTRATVVQGPANWQVSNAGTFAVQPAGSVAHDGVGTAVNPLLNGFYGYAAIPADTSADGDATRSIGTRAGQGRMVIDVNATQVGWTQLFDSSITNVAEALKASAGVLGQIVIWNTNANDAFLQLFNLATGSVIPGTTTPIAVYPLTGGTTNNPGKTVIDIYSSGINFSTAITYLVATTATGGTAVTTPVAGTFLYK